MSDRNEKYRQKYMESLQPKVEAPIQEIGVFSRPGSMGSVFLSQVSPAAAMIKNRSSKGKAGGLPQNVVLALTEDKVYVFGFKPRGFGIKVKDPIAVWDRSGVVVSVTGESAVAKHLHFQLSDGEAIELDSNQMPGFPNDFNLPFVLALSPSSN